MQLSNTQRYCIQKGGQNKYTQWATIHAKSLTKQHSCVTLSHGMDYVDGSLLSPRSNTALHVRTKPTDFYWFQQTFFTTPATSYFTDTTYVTHSLTPHYYVTASQGPSTNQKGRF